MYLSVYLSIYLILSYQTYLIYQSIHVYIYICYYIIRHKNISTREGTLQLGPLTRRTLPGAPSTNQDVRLAKWYQRANPMTEN